MNRKPRLLWANAYCLLDTSSGASISIRQILLQLLAEGFEIDIVGATVFDSDHGVTWIRDHLSEIKEKRYVNITESSLTHRLTVTQSTFRSEMRQEEITNWYNLYVHRLDEFKPDVVFFYGGQPVDYLIPYEARRRGIPSVAYLVNGNYQGVRWLADVDRVITDTIATAEFYTKYGFHPVPCGKFIDPAKVIPLVREPKHILFINPSLQKGVGILIQLAIQLEETRPDITFEVVKSRGDWDIFLKEISSNLGTPREVLKNVIVTPNTTDMRPVYGRAKMLLAPSLWWESGARVLAEAMLCGIPAIVTDHGGNAEMVMEGGIKVRLPAECHEKPYNQLPRTSLLEPLTKVICKLYDDHEFYTSYSERAAHVGRRIHSMSNSTAKLIKVLEPLIAKKSGDNNFLSILKENHKHNLHLSEIVEQTENSNPLQLSVELKPGEKGIFIDCGGYDGCSAVKFMIANPTFDCISFEPNPVLWPFYNNVPTTLIRKAAYTHWGKCSFWIDDHDADGSSVIEGKQIDFHGRTANEQCRKIEVECVDLADLVRDLSEIYQRIILKLDVEGAEYDILERLLNEGLLDRVTHIYAEFHWHKCGVSEDRHFSLVRATQRHTSISDWDALNYSVYQGSEERAARRNDILKRSFCDVSRYQNLSKLPSKYLQ